MSDQGGAATAALRLHKGLLDLGMPSSFLSLQRGGIHQYPNQYQFQKKTTRLNLGQRIRRKIAPVPTQAQQNAKLLEGLQGQYETFSFPRTDFKVEDDPRVQEADIINLHWISYFINYPTFFPKIKKPVVWTFHDMNPFMGGFHYRGDFERNPAFSKLEDQLKQEKQSILEEHKNITVVTPSQWIGEAARQSPAFRSKPWHHIPYGLDTSIFKPQDQAYSRTVFNLPLDHKIILFVTERISNFRKGFDLLIESLKSVNSSQPYTIVAIGERTEELKTLPQVVSLGKIHDEYLLSVLYSAADIFVLPSREDNFPNVMLEALACGTPIMAFNTGGMRETIQHGSNGILVDAISARELGAALNAYLQNSHRFDRDLIRQAAVDQFALSVQASRYATLYQSLVSSSTQSR
ncbi:Glycosyltransferase involved in cell wall bisynthesis [Chryseolinea serpens]|uniref:Glycosyltransferase involved in cell wall bisynthesis n=1 Tax=Chryseolinea serpens TaxID=947013 RepID=A0A1M5KXU5_9BACT|nr:glycosyltransferase [Chryseolinea serpens]SHG57692.1 Glycosyltransferase involved in cell wall bisynthesis [Chryseolinea serpens]